MVKLPVDGHFLIEPNYLLTQLRPTRVRLRLVFREEHPGSVANHHPQRRLLAQAHIPVVVTLIVDDELPGQETGGGWGGGHCSCCCDCGPCV